MRFIYCSVLCFAAFLFNSALIANNIIVKRSITEFGANPNDGKSDQLAFEKAARFINGRGGNVELHIPAGTYIIGRQKLLKSNAYYLQGVPTLELIDCSNVKIIGEPGTLLTFDVGMRFGTFNVKTGLSNNSSWACNGGVATRHSSQRATLGKVVNVLRCNNIYITNLNLDGNFYPASLNNMNSFKVRGVKYNNHNFMKSKINLGGSYGGCGINLSHYGIFVMYSGGVHIDHCIIKRFGTDGIQVANYENDSNQRDVVISNCTIDYNARTGISITGGNGITVRSCRITNTGQDVSFSTGTAIDIEAQRDSKYNKKYVKNVIITDNFFENNISGAILTKFGMGSSNVTIENNTFNSSFRALNMGSKNVEYRVRNNTINGKGGVFFNGVKQNVSRGVNSVKSSVIFENNKQIR